MPDREKTFNRDEVFPSYWPNRLSAFLATLHANFRLQLANATTVQVPAGVSEDMVALGIDGRMRFNEATVTRAHPGGAAGTYDVFVTAANPNVVNAPAPNTDNTNYAFALAIVPVSTFPAIVAGTVDIFRKVGQLEWSGAAITRLTNLINRGRDGEMVYASNQLATQTPLAARGQVGQSAPLLTAGTATDVDKLSLSSAGQLALPVAGATGGLLIGADATLYRSASNVLRTDSRMSAGVGVLATATAAQAAFRAEQTAANAALINHLLAADANPAFRVFGDGKHEWGGGGASAPDANLYRSAVDQLKTDDRMLAGQGFFADTAVANPALASVRTAGQLVTRNFLLAADAQPAFQIAGDGTHNWGAGGATAPDTNLFRSGVDTLRTDDALSVGGQVSGDSTVISTRASAGQFAFQARITGDTQPHGAMLADGQLQWGPGGASVFDTNLYRGAVDQLKTDDRLIAALGLLVPATSNPGLRTEQIAANQALAQFLLAADANPAFRVLGSGKLEWGGGGASAVDANLFRLAASSLKTDGLLTAGVGLSADTASASPALASVRTAAQPVLRSLLLTGDANPAFALAGDGGMLWGAGGATAPDAGLVRTGVAGLRLGSPTVGLVVDSVSGNAAALKYSGALAPQLTFNSGGISLSTGNTGGLGLLTASAGNPVFQWDDTGLRFFAGTPRTTKQTVTGAKGGNAALTSLLAALAAYGLVTDSST